MLYFKFYDNFEYLLLYGFQFVYLGSRFDRFNNMPISLTSIIGKLMENVLYI